jgi:hypothetical protein
MDGNELTAVGVSALADILKSQCPSKFQYVYHTMSSYLWPKSVKSVCGASQCPSMFTM